MKSRPTFLRATVLAFVTILGLDAASGATIIWNSGSGTDTNWSTALNWAGGVAPTSVDDVRFFNDGANVTVSNINNVVDATQSILSLQYGNTNNFHTTFIPTGVTLTNTGALTVGTETDNGAVQVVTATITGAGGRLVMNSTANLIVRQTSATAGVHPATLDLSGLDTFVANIGRIQVADGGVNRPQGILILAKTNIITLTSGTSPQISLALSGGNDGAQTSRIVLGQTNAIFADNIFTGRQKQTGNNSIFFNPLYTNNNPVAYFRSASGGRMTAWEIGNGEANSGTTAVTGTNDFSGGTVDAQVTTMTVGRASSNSNTSGGTARGTLTFNSGIIDVNTLNLGIQTSSSPRNGIGVINVNGGTLFVNTVLNIGQGTGGTGLPGVGGTLNIQNGTARISSIVPGATTGTNGSVINITSGLLVVTNTIGTPTNALTTLTLSDAVLSFASYSTTSTNSVVTNLNCSGTVNLIDLSAVSSAPSFPATFHLIKYTTLNGTFNIGPTNLASSFTGYVTNDTANLSVDLVITAGHTAQAVTWSGSVNANWNESTANWLFSGSPTNFINGDLVTFNDSSSTTNINVISTVQPGSMTVNATKQYILGGSGSIGGASTLSKLGAGTLIFTNTAANSFNGAISISAGTLQVGNGGASGTIGSGALSNNASLVFNRSDSLTIGNAISGPTSGTISQNGVGTVTLSGANTFTGAVTVAQGILTVGNNTALGATNGSTTVNSGAALDVGGGALGANALDTGGEPIIVSGSGPGGAGAIVNTRTGVNQQNALRYVTLTGDTTFGGAGRWDIRAVGGTTGDPATASLSTGGQPYNLTKTGAVTVAIVSTVVDPALANISIQQGTISFEGNTTGGGNTSSSLTVASGATLQFFALTNLFNKQITLNGTVTNNVVNVSSGTNIVIGPMSMSGDCIFNVGGSTVTLVASNTMSGAGANLIKNGAGTLTLAGASDNYSGSTTVSNGTLIVNNILTGGGTLTALTNATLGGNGTNTGPVIVGGALSPGASAGTFGAGGLTLNPGATLMFELNTVTTIGSGINDLVQVNGDLTINSNSINIILLGSGLQAGSYRLFNYTGSLIGDFNPAVTVLGGASRYSLAINTNTPGQVNLVVGGSNSGLRWNSTTTNRWDIGTSSNWFNVGASVVDVFYQADRVLFDDTASVQTAIDIPVGVAVAPVSVTNNSTVNNFLISGAGKITGLTGLIKDGGSKLTIASTNDFTGATTIRAGTLVVSNSGAMGALPGGSVTVSNGATLDMGITPAANVLNFGQKQFYVAGTGVGGAGAVVNNGGANQQNAFQKMTLTGNTTVGGANRWDLRGGPPILDLAGFTLTKISTNQITSVGGWITSGSLDIQQGVFSVETTSSITGAVGTITIRSGAALGHFSLVGGALTRPITSEGGSIRILGGNNATNDSNITLTGDSYLDSNGQTASCTLNGTISGSFGVIKTNGGTFILTAPNTYSGSTIARNGTLSLNGNGSISNTPSITVFSNAVLNVTNRVDGTLTLGGGKTLAGGGTLVGSLVAASGARILPGDSGRGTLQITNGSLTLQGGVTNVFELASTTNGVSDRIAVAGNLNLSGVNTIALSFSGLQAGRYRIITYTGAKTGGAANLTFGGSVASTRLSLSIDDSVTNEIAVVVSGSTADLVWVGDGSLNNWDLVTTSNWLNGVSLDRFYNADSVTFNDSGSQSPAVNLVGSLGPSAIAASAAADYTFSGSGQIATASLTKDGAGKLTIANVGTNELSGAISIDSGILQLGSDSGGGNNTITAAGITNNGALVLSQSNNLSVASATSGSGSITNNGAGTLTIGGLNSYSGGLTLNNGGTTRLTTTNAAGQGVTIAVNSATLVGAATPTNSITNSIVLSSGTLGVAVADLALAGGQLTAASGLNKVWTTDPQNPSTTRNVFADGALRGSGNILVINATNVTSPDGGQGFRLRSADAGNSDFSGTITLTNNVKGEMRTTQGGPFSPAGTGKFIMVCGTYNGSNAVTTAVSGGYSELNIRNNSGGNTVLNNDVELVGAGAAVLNPLSDTGGGGTVAPPGSSAKLGNLKMAGGQELIIYGSAGGPFIFEFQNATLTGGTITLSPKSPTFGATTQTAGDLVLGDISQTSASSVVMNGLRSLTLNGASAYTGTTTVSNGNLVVNGQILSTGAVTVRSNATLSGTGGISGAVTILGNATLSPGTNTTTTSTLSMSNSLSLTDSTNIFDLALANNDLVAVTGSLTASGTNTVVLRIVDLVAKGSFYTLFQYGGSLLPGAASVSNSIRLVSPDPDYAFSVVDPATTPGLIRIKVDAAPGNDFWSGNLTAGAETVWDNGVTTNWIVFGNPNIFNNNDLVNFDDSALTNFVTLTGILTPKKITMVNNSVNYTFAGAGGLSGLSNGVVLNALGKLTLANSGSNDFASLIHIEAGTLQVGNGGTTGGLARGGVTNNGTLVFNRSDALTITNLLSGSGNSFLIKSNSTGVLTLSGANTYASFVTIQEGTLRTLNSLALGNTNGDTTIAAGATLDIASNNVNIIGEIIRVSGAGVGGKGAIVNNSGSGAFANENIGRIVMTGNTVIGGTGRLDLRPNNITATPTVYLSTEGNPYKLTKVGTNQFSMVSVIVDDELGDIEVLEGTLSIEKRTTTLGNIVNTLTISNNATLQFFQTSNTLYKPVLMKDGAIMNNNSGANIFGGPLTLTGSNRFNIGGASLTLTNVISGAGTLSQITGGAALFLSAGNDYTGPTYVNSGTLVLTNEGSINTSPLITVASGATLNVLGRVDGTLTLTSGQKLQGTGTVRGNVIVPSGSTIAPGTSAGTLTITNGTLNLQGSTIMEIDKNAGTRDHIQGPSLITYGGTLSISNLNSPFKANDTFKLFSAVGNNYAGSFTNIVPTIPAPHMRWDTSRLTVDGTLKVYGGPGLQLSFPGSGITVISGTNGISLGGYYLYATTNLSLPLSQWTILTNSTFDAFGNFSFTNSANIPRRYFMLELQNY